MDNRVTVGYEGEGREEEGEECGGKWGSILKCSAIGRGRCGLVELYQAHMRWSGKVTRPLTRRGAGALPTSVGMVDTAWMEREQGNPFIGFQSIRIHNLIRSIDGKRYSS